LYSTCACRVQPATWDIMSIPDTHHNPNDLARASTSKSMLAPPGLETVLQVLLTPRTLGLQVRLADCKDLRILENSSRRGRGGEVERVQRGPVRCVKKTKESCPFKAVRPVMFPFSLSHAIVTYVCITFMTRKRRRKGKSTAVQQQENISKTQKQKRKNQ
jgi:hypothetical protein